MPTSFVDQFWIIDPYNPPAVGTLLTVQNYTVTDNNNNGLINRFSNDSIDGVDIRASYPGDTVTVDAPGGGTITYTGITFYLRDGREVFTPTDGGTLTDATLANTTFVTTQGSTTPAEMAPTCFTPGTLIQTANGPRPVQELSNGDLIATADRGHVRLRLMHQRTLSMAHLQENPDHCPVLIRAGSMGQGLPSRDLTVSPQHRMLLRSAVVERMFDVPEILVPACQLVGQVGVSRLKPSEPVHYLHLLLDHHGVVFAENTPTESLFMGEQASEGFSSRELDMIAKHLPAGAAKNMQPARLFVRGKRLRKLLSRHAANQKHMLDSPQAASAQLAQTA